MDLVVEDGSRVGTVYFLMSEENVERQVKLPWVSFGSDAGAPAPEGAFLRSNPHPRAYGNFARLLGHYVRDRRLIPLAEAIRRLTALPAANLGLRDRGRPVNGVPRSVRKIRCYHPRPNRPMHDAKLTPLATSRSAEPGTSACLADPQKPCFLVREIGGSDHGR